MSAIERRYLRVKSDPDYTVYELRGKDRKVYVGITTHPSRRENEHRKNAEKKRFFGTNDIGVADFEFVKIVVNVDYDLASKLEAQLILQHRGDGSDLLNRSFGGEKQMYYGKRTKGKLSVNNIKFTIQEHDYKLDKLGFYRFYGDIYENDDALKEVADWLTDCWLASEEHEEQERRFREMAKSYVEKFRNGEISESEFDKLYDDYLESPEYLTAYYDFIGYEEGKKSINKQTTTA